jgi:broad-specificity NMP kinase
MANTNNIVRIIRTTKTIERKTKNKEGSVIILTGTPGTGKDTIAKFLAKQGYIWIPLNDVVNLLKIWYKKERGVKVVNLSKLKRAIDVIVQDARKSNSKIILEGHLACEVPIRTDLCIVLRTETRILRRRLRARGWPRWKIDENIECEMIDYCTQQAEKNLEGPIYEIDTSGPKTKTIKAVSAILRLFTEN